MKARNKRLIVVFLFALIMSAGCQAQDKGPANPEGCINSGFKFSGKELILNNGSGDALNLFLFHNTAEETVYINHEPKDPGASAGWSTELGAGNWTAISMSTPDFAFTCGKMVPGRFEEFTCSDALKVCKFSNPAFNEKSSGSYWVSENKPLDATLETIKSRGIELKK